MSSPSRARGPAPAGGFTLIELLAVILILSILAVVLITNLRDATEAAERQTTAQLLAKIESTLEHYENDFGRYPPSSFTADQEVSNDGENVGGEALVVALWSKKWQAGGLLEDVKDSLVNTDGDTSPRQLTDFETRGLLEIPDAWDNPVAYIERADYGVTGRSYLTRAGGGEEHSSPAAFKKGITGLYYRSESFQLISAGPDGVFATEDDITNFERE